MVEKAENHPVQIEDIFPEEIMPGITAVCLPGETNITTVDFFQNGKKVPAAAVRCGQNVMVFDAGGHSSMFILESIAIVKGENLDIERLEDPEYRAKYPTICWKQSVTRCIRVSDVPEGTWVETTGTVSFPDYKIQGGTLFSEKEVNWYSLKSESAGFDDDVPTEPLFTPGQLIGKTSQDFYQYVVNLYVPDFSVFQSGEVSPSALPFIEYFPLKEASVDVGLELDQGKPVYVEGKAPSDKLTQMIFDYDKWNRDIGKGADEVANLVSALIPLFSSPDNNEGQNDKALRAFLTCFHNLNQINNQANAVTAAIFNQYQAQTGSPVLFIDGGLPVTTI